MKTLQTICLALLFSTFSSAYAGDCFKDGDVNDCKAKSLRQDYNALNELGTIYYTGRGVEQNYRKALESWQGAAQQGNVASQLNLGFMYAEGEGVAQNYPAALGWFKRAAEQGDTFAAEQVKVVEARIAEMEDTEAAEEQYQLGLQESRHKEAFEWFLKAAEQGHKDALSRIWTTERISAQLVDADQYFRIGNMVRKSDNIFMAGTWYEKAATKGHADAQYVIGRHYETRDDGMKSDTQALSWYEKAAKQGHADAVKRIQIIGEEREQRQAIIDARRAEHATANNINTAITLAVIIAFIAILIAGMNNKVVIYYDMRDFYIALMSWGSIIIGAFIDGMFEGDIISGIIRTLTYVSAVIFFAWSIKASIFYNKATPLGIIVGIFKATASLLGALMFLGALNKMFSKEGGLKDFLVGTVILGAFVWIGKQLINGERVYRSKGWDLPETAGAQLFNSKDEVG